MARASIRSAFLAALLSLVLSLPAMAAMRPVYGGSARLGAAGSITTHDPALASAESERLLASAVHCTVADVVASIEPEGERRLRLQLEDNLVFHDGTRLRAEDVARSLKRVAAMEGPFSAWRLLAIASAENDDSSPGGLAIEVTGPTSLEVELASPKLDLLAWLRDPGLAIVKEDGYTGCGPFTIEGSLPLATEPPGEPNAPSVSLVAFERHPRGRPFLDRLEIVLSPRGSSAVQGADELDGAAGLLARREGSVIVPDRHLVSLRLAGRGWRDEALYAGISAAIDRDGMARLFMGAGARPISELALLVEKDSPGLQREARGGRGGAGRLPEELVIVHDASSPTERRLAERIQLRLHDAGVRVRLQGRAGLATRSPGSPRGRGGHRRSAGERSDPSIGRAPRSEGGGEPGTPSRTHVVLDVQNELPDCPVMRLVAIAHRHGGDRVARRVLSQVLADDGAPLTEIAATLQAELGLIPIAGGPGRFWTSSRLLLAPGTTVLDPAEMWRLPDDLAPYRGGP